MGAAVLLSYANGKIEELDASRQRLIKEIAALNAETISPQKIEFPSAHYKYMDTELGLYSIVRPKSREPDP